MFEQFTQWKRDLERISARYEQTLTYSLIILAVIIVLVAFYGKPHHKAMLAIYLVV